LNLNKKIPYSKIINLNFGIICFILLSDLNGVFEALIGISQLLSPIILLCCCINLFLLSIEKKYFIFNKQIILILSFYTFYFFFSGFIRILNYNKLFYGIPFYTLFTGYFSSILIISGIYFSIIFLIKNNRKQFVFNVIVIALVFSTATVLFTDISGVGNFTQSSDDLDNSRASGFFTNPNEAGLVANLCLIFLIFFFIDNTKNKLLIILLISASLYASFRSFSKTSMLFSVLLSGYFFYFLYRYQLNKRKSLKIVVTLFISAIVFLSIYAVNNLDELTKDWDSNQKIRIEAFILIITKGELASTTDTERSEAFTTGLRMIKESPFVGKGYGYLQYGIISDNQGVHNLYLTIFGESGIVGIILFLSIFISLFIHVLANFNNKTEVFLFCSIIALILVNCMASHNLLLFRPINVSFALLAALTLKKNYNKNLVLKQC
jgi:hypothetical protein